jgi:hypothetical protein
MKIYLVGDYGPEHYSVKSVHRTKAGALKAWNRHRLYLLQDAKSSLKRCKNKFDRDMYKEIIKNLSCKDPKKIDNGAQETPFIEEKEVEE